MMRPIKFRGIVSDPESPMFGEFVFGDLLRGYLYERKDKRGKIYIKTKAPLCFEIRPETVGQFVGFSDCECGDIYEGDILEVNYIDDEEKSLHEVVWGGSDYPAFDLKPSIVFCESNALSHITQSGDYFYKVVGNIHEGQKIL